jgi:hypothetical protein
VRLEAKPAVEAVVPGGVVLRKACCVTPAARDIACLASQNLFLPVPAEIKTKVWSIDRHAFKYLAKRAKQEEQKRLLALFATMPLFDGLNDEYLEQLVAVAHEV